LNVSEFRKKLDFGKTAADYGRHRAGFPPRFFDTLFNSGKIRKGDHVLDLGTGTGVLGRGLALRGCDVTGLDRSRELLDEAKRLDRQVGVSIRYVQASAEETGLPADSFDIVSAGTCWHWFDRDRAAAEARRLLKPDGRIIIAHFDWVPLPGNIVEATEQLIGEHNHEWKLGGRHGIHPLWFKDLAIAGFVDLEAFAFDEPVTYSHEDWRGRVRASGGVGATLSLDAVERFDVALKALLAERFPGDPLTVPHRVWTVTGRNPGQNYSALPRSPEAMD
jgi:SAM-dependent methyltransferase